MEKKILGIFVCLLFFGAGVTPCLTDSSVEASNINSNVNFDSCIECGCGDNKDNNISPTNTLTESTIKYYRSVADKCFGTSGGGTAQRAIRITSKELSSYSGWSLKAGRFYHCVSASRTGYLKIYSQGTSTAPGSLLAQKRFSISNSGWIRIDLDQPIQLDIKKDYWISIEMTNRANEYPMGADNGPSVDGKGAWYYDGEKWYELQYQQGTSFDINYNIEAIVSSPTGNKPPIANAGGPYNAEPGVEIQFDGSNSYDPDGYITSYEWDFGDGQKGSGVKPKHTYSTENDYKVTLTVTDNAHVLASSYHSIIIPIWFLMAKCTSIFITNNVSIKDINNPFWIAGNPTKIKSIADDLQSTGSGSFTVTTKWFSLNSLSGLNFIYNWFIYDQSGKEVKSAKQQKVTATGSGSYWTGSFNVNLPSKVGKYTFKLSLWFPFALIEIPQATLYVTWASPRSSVSPPQERWLEVATTWASGANSEVSAAEKLIDSEYANPFNWVYGYEPKDKYTRVWTQLIDKTTGDSADCYGFAMVWWNLSRVLGLNTKYDYYSKNGGFLTSTKYAIDDNADANARNLNNKNNLDRWFFGSHCVGNLLSKSTNEYYDPTFGMKGFDSIDAGAEYVIESWSPDSQGFYRFYKVSSSSQKKLVDVFPKTDDDTTHGWPIHEYKNLASAIIEEERKVFSTQILPLVSDIIDEGLDTDGNGLFDYLMTNITIEVPHSGNYFINGILHVNNNVIDSGSNTPSNAKNTSLVGVIEYLNSGMNNIVLYFNGKQIFDSHLNGPYNISLIIGDETDIVEQFITSYYNYTQFQGLLLEIINVSDYGEDNNGDYLFENLTVDVQVNAITEGNYSFQTILSYNNQTIDSKQKNLYLNQGISTISLKLDGQKIYQKRQNGPYIFSLLLSDNNYYNDIVYNTKDYKYTNFQRPEAYFKSYTDKGTDTNGNGLYEYLSITANVYINTSGNYIIQGNLQNNTAWASVDGYFYAGSQNIVLNFDGTAVYRLWNNGPYQLSHIAILDENSNLVDSVSNGYTTSFYNYADFEPPTAFIQEFSSDYGVDTNNNNLYEYLAVKINLSVISPGNYTLVGSLNPINNSGTIAVASTVSFLVPIIQSIVLFFNGSTIYKHGIEGPYVLGSITLSNENGTQMDFKNNLNNILDYTFTDFEGGSPTLEFDIIGERGINVVIRNNGTINATNVEWQIHVEGGILGKINKTINDAIDVLVGELKIVGTGILFGLGPITITVKVADEEKIVEGTQFIIFSKVK